MQKGLSHPYRSHISRTFCLFGKTTLLLSMRLCCARVLK